MNDYNDYTDGIALYHHGVQGMKWGVWNDETRAKRMGGRGRIGSAQRVQSKMNRINDRLTKSSDKGFIRRNTINDYRRGRLGDLEVKYKHRLAKESYKAKHKKAKEMLKKAKDTESKEDYREIKKGYKEGKKAAKQEVRKARGERIVRNFLNEPFTTMNRGQQQRYINIGNDIIVANRKANAAMTLANLALGAYSTGSDSWAGKGEQKY